MRQRDRPPLNGVGPLQAGNCVEGPDRAGLERLLRYCARPPVAMERLEQLGEDALIYRFDQPLPDGRTQLRLTPLQLIERLAALIPPPRLPEADGQICPARAVKWWIGLSRRLENYVHFVQTIDRPSRLRLLSNLRFLPCPTNTSHHDADARFGEYTLGALSEGSTIV